MLLADLGAEVIRLDRPGGYPPPAPSLKFEEMGANAYFNRGRRSLRVDLKTAEGQALARRLLSRADAVVEGYRPGTMERLNIGPDRCLAANPKLVYVRTTGWGQGGPLAPTAGHDLNYIGMSGALSLFGTDGVLPPGIPPLIGDMAGGGLFMALGVLAGVLCARETGVGQVVDAAIIDGSAVLYTLLSALQKSGGHTEPAGRNILDGGRYYYRTYRCADRGYVAVGAIEPAFRKALLEGLNLHTDEGFASAAPQDDAYCTTRLAEIFAGQPRDHWRAVFDGSDACVTPVLSLSEAERDSHARARASFVEVEGVVQPAPAPRFERTPGRVAIGGSEASRNDPDVLLAWGFDADEIAQLRASGAVS
jgi:alpha-methylacyl-CoA racemase